MTTVDRSAELRHTSIGCGLWTWKPWISLPAQPRLLWLALYSTASAKRSVPGLWPGTLHGMADEVRLTLNETYGALTELCAGQDPLVVYDEDSRLARLTKLLDVAERAHNDRALYGWWTRFRSLTASPLRDVHVPLLWWLVSSGNVSDKMREAWNSTFGTIKIPSSVPLFRPPGSNDTSTPEQTCLFAPQRLNPTTEKTQVGSGLPDVSETSRSLRGRDQDLVPGQVLDLVTGSGSFSLSSSDRITASPADQAQTPRLELVPPPANAPFSVDDVLEALGLRDDALMGLSRDGLWAEIARMAEAGMGKLELDLVSRWANARIGPRDRIEIITTARLGDAVSRARQWDDERRKRAEHAAECSADWKAAQDNAKANPRA